MYVQITITIPMSNAQRRNAIPIKNDLSESRVVFDGSLESFEFLHGPVELSQGFIGVASITCSDIGCGVSESILGSLDSFNDLVDPGVEEFIGTFF